jgi:hypothetical protein
MPHSVIASPRLRLSRSGEKLLSVPPSIGRPSCANPDISLVHKVADMPIDLAARSDILGQCETREKPFKPNSDRRRILLIGRCGDFGLSPQSLQTGWDHR